jgi:hypothetical protein
MLTVRDLLKSLESLDPETLVVLDAGGVWYDHVSDVQTPLTDPGFSCVTLFHGEEFDARDL